VFFLVLFFFFFCLVSVSVGFSELSPLDSTTDGKMITDGREERCREV
jgi:hypothetical protein